MKYFLTLLLSFNACSEYTDFKIDTNSNHSLSTLFHVKSNFLLSSEINLGDDKKTFIGLSKGYREGSFYLAGGYEGLYQDSSYHNGLIFNAGYKPKRAEYAASLMLRYNENFDELEKDLGLHFRFSEKVYMTVGTNIKDSLYIGIRRWL